TIADADDADRRDAARLLLREKAPLDCRQQRLGHRMSASRSADEHGIAVLDQLRRLVCRDLFHRSFESSLFRYSASRRASSVAPRSQRQATDFERVHAVVVADFDTET